MRDFDYIQRKFIGLRKLIIKFSGDLNDDDTINKLAADGILLPQNYMSIFDYLISLRHFGLIGFPLISGVDKTLAYWSQQPRLKEVKIVEALADEREAILLTVLNTRVLNEINNLDTKDPEDGSWQLTLDIHCRNFKDFYQQILDRFKSDAVVKICLASALGEPLYYQPATSDTLGNYLGYIIDHYKAVKKLQLKGAKFKSFYADTTYKQLEALEFTAYSIKPGVLLRLSSSIAYVSQLSFTSCVALDSNEPDDIFDINMPQTAIEELNVDHDYNENCAYLVTLCTSDAVQSIRYLCFDKNKTLEVNVEIFEKLTATGGLWYTKVSVRCLCLGTLSASSSFQCITLNIQ
ncbi:unnamed protein product [Mucor fragilis]